MQFAESGSQSCAPITQTKCLFVSIKFTFALVYILVVFLISLDDTCVYIYFQLSESKQLFDFVAMLFYIIMRISFNSKAVWSIPSCETLSAQII